MRAFTLTMLLALGPAIAQAPVDDSAPPYTDPDAPAVYAAVLAKMAPRHAHVDVIRTQTFGWRMCIQLTDPNTDPVAAVLANYTEINAHPWTLGPRIELPAPHLWIDRDQFDALMKAGSPDHGGWDAFYRAHQRSGGVTSLSAVGFDAGHTLAVVYAGRACGNLCGSGRFYLFQKIDGAWIDRPFRGSACSVVARVDRSASLE